MGKKHIVPALVVTLAIGAVVFTQYQKYSETADRVSDTGSFRSFFSKPPAAAYLSEEEEKLRPAYQQLDDTEKALYEALYRGITNKEDFIALPFEVSGDTYSKVYCMLEKEEGEFFFLGSSYYTADTLNEAHIVYREGKDIDNVQQQELKKAEETALDAVKGRTDDYEKVLAINDYIVQHCEYVSGADREYSPTTYGCLVEKKANCEGYAKTFGMLAADLGLESILITGVTDKGENHAWNQVKVDGDWYNIDVTWADNDEGDEIRRAYFLCDDGEFLETHTADTKYIMPMECSATKNNYYVRNGLYVESEEKAEKIIENAILAGEKTIEMKFADSDLYSEFRQKYITEQYIFDKLIENGREFNDDMSISIKEGESDNCICLYIG